MKKKNYLRLAIIAVLLFLGGYWYYNSIAIWGASDNGMWKATYRKNFDYVEGGWNGTIKQKSGPAVTVKEVKFTDNGKQLMSTGDFEEGVSEDGEKTVLYPLSAEFYGLGDPPKKGHVYKLYVTWTNKGKEETDMFVLK
ncbi:hypothetical protein [Priestia sp. JNUCC 25]